MSNIQNASPEKTLSPEIIENNIKVRKQIEEMNKEFLRWIDWEDYQALDYYYFDGKEHLTIANNDDKTPRMINDKKWLDNWRKDGRSLLHRYYTNVGSYRYLIEMCKINPFIKNSERETPLEYFIKLKMSNTKPCSDLLNDIIAYLERAEIKALKKISTLFYLDRRDKENPIPMTVKRDETSISRLKKGENLDDWRDDYGNTILHRTYYPTDGDLILRTLLEIYKVNPFIKNSKGETIRETIENRSTFDIRKRSHKRIHDIIVKAEENYKK